MEQNNTVDLDVMHLYTQFKRNITKGIVLAFKALNFILKKWWIIVLLIAVGVAAGYLVGANSEDPQKATALLRVNYDAVNYVYNEVDLINEKIREGDSIFFVNMGLRPDSLEVAELLLTPVVNLKDLGEKYEDIYRNIDGFIKNVEFDKSEIEVAETFNKEYKYHSLDLVLAPNANRETIDKIIEYLNSDELLRQLKDTTIKNKERRIITNEEIVGQIDKMIETYTNNQSVNAATGPMFVVDKDFSLHTLLNKKTDLIIRNEVIKQELIMSQDIVVVTNKASLVKVQPGLLGKKIIRYPLFFVFTFLLMAWMRYVFFYLKKLADDNK